MSDLQQTAYKSPSPTQIMDDINAMLEASTWPGPKRFTHSGPAGMFRAAGFDVPADIPDERGIIVDWENAL
jgi:hypothetical protein